MQIIRTDNYARENRSEVSVAKDVPEATNGHGYRVVQAASTLPFAANPLEAIWLTEHGLGSALMAVPTIGLAGLSVARYTLRNLAIRAGIKRCGSRGCRIQLCDALDLISSHWNEDRSLLSDFTLESLRLKPLDRIQARMNAAMQGVP